MTTNKELERAGYRPRPLIVPSTIRTVRLLNKAALAGKWDRELIFWYLLQASNQDGNGACLLSEVRHLFVDILKKHSTASFYRILGKGKGKGKGKLWEVYRHLQDGDSTIKIRGLPKVCATNSISLPSFSRFVEVPISDIPDSDHLGQARAMLHTNAAYRTLTDKNIHPYTRAAIADITGVYRRKQQRWDNLAKKNGTLIVEKSKVKTLDVSNRYRRVVRQVESISKTTGQRKVWHVYSQLGNICRTTSTTGNKGVLKILSRSHKAELLNGRASSLVVGQAQPEHSMAKPRLQKVYYTSHKSLLQAHQKGKAGELGYVQSKTNSRTFFEVGMGEYA